ncbi:hypothetical protein [Kineococcus sp. NUM-3379]
MSSGRSVPAPVGAALPRAATGATSCGLTRRLHVDFGRICGQGCRA